MRERTARWRPSPIRDCTAPATWPLPNVWLGTSGEDQATEMLQHQLRTFLTRSITQRVRNRFNLSVAEVGGQQTWQRAELGLCAVGGDRAYTRGLMERAIEFVEELHLAEVVAADIEVVNMPYEPQPYGDRSGEEPAPEE